MSSSLSRFAFVAYDKTAANEQNSLRARFVELEQQVQAKDASGVSDLPIPENEYADAIATFKQNCMYHLNAGQIEPALVDLEILYFLIGKAVRLDCVKRINSPAFS